MNPISLFCILAGVTLNAGAQLLLKAGVNAVGHFEFTRANIVPIGLKLATQVPIVGGLACYVVNAFAAWYLFGEALSVHRLAGIAIILVGVVVLARS